MALHCYLYLFCWHSQFQLMPNESTTLDHLDDETPLAFLPCQWKAPKRERRVHYRLHSQNLKKPAHGKSNPDLLENFDPWPAQYRGMGKDHLQAHLDNVHGKSLCISLLYDKTCQSSRKADSPVDTKLSSTESLKQTLQAFKSSLSITEGKIHKIKHDKRQKNLSLWYEMQRYHLTAFPLKVSYKGRAEAIGQASQANTWPLFRS